MISIIALFKYDRVVDVEPSLLNAVLEKRIEQVGMHININMLYRRL